jgi:3',5'-cyclic-AMP phosphodiesterase
MIKLIVFTDTHLVPEGQRIIGLDPYARLAAGIAHVNKHHADAAQVIFTGDLTHNGDAASYTRLRQLLGQLTRPYALLLGNHDSREQFLTAFPETPCDADGFVQQVLAFGDTRLLLLDTVHGPPYPGGQTFHAGRYCAARCHWLAQRLREQPGAASYVFMHHPPHKTGFAGMDAIRLQDEAAFYDVILAAGNVRHLFAGHIHRTIHGTHRGIPYSVFKGTCHQQPMTFDSLDTKIAVDEPAAYGIVFIDRDGVQVHTEDYQLAADIRR